MNAASLIDGHGRTMGDLRISVTDRCNLRCRYCMPAEGLPWLDRDELLTYEEITRLAAIFATMGVSSVRLSGGEPLVRKELHRLVAMLTATPGIEEVSLTTNGVMLGEQAPALAAAGLSRVNVSLDSLVAGRFEEVTRRDALDRVLAGLEAAEREPSLRPIRVNVVAVRGFTEDDVLAFAEFARRTPYEVRFIEFMPLDAQQQWSPDQVLTGAEVRARIEEVHRLEPLEREPHATSSRWRFADGSGEIGFISPVSEPFCDDCDRLRLTADGQLRTCLFSLRETDLRAPLRDGVNDEQLEQIVRAAVWRKELKHRVNDPGFVQPDRPMSRIGG